MKRKAIAAITALLICGVTIAWADMIYLKNGSVIKGRIIETAPNVSYKIETRDGSIFVFKMEDIERVLFEEEEKSVVGERVKFSIIPFYGRWEPKEIVDESSHLSGINLRWKTEKKYSFQFEFGYWRYEEVGVEGTCYLFSGSGLYLTKPFKTAIPVNLYGGGGIGVYMWDVVDDNSSLGFHFCGGMELSPSENFSVGLELRQIIGKVNLFDRDWKYDGFVPIIKAVFTL